MDMNLYKISEYDCGQSFTHFSFLLHKIYLKHWNRMNRRGIFNFLLILTISLLFSFPSYSTTVKVACVGNSVTYGYGIENRMKTYPKQLQELLGQGYDVRNFGHSGATLLKKGHNPYWKTSEMSEALAFKPDIVIIHLGLNDTDPRNWPKFRDDFTKDYLELIRTFQSTHKPVRIWICRMTPIFTRHPRFKSTTRTWYRMIQTEIERVAEVAHVGLIDLYTPLYNRPDLFPDALHPTEEGAGILAQTVFHSITGDFGGLQLSSLFSDHMVLQQNKPIRFYGTANAGSIVSVNFAGKTVKTEVPNTGKWNVQFPPMQADNISYNVSIKNETKEIVLSDVVLGEVWLCSGQSNMAFPLRNALTAKEDIAHAQNSKLRFFDMKEIAPTSSIAWTDSVLDAVNRLQYFKPTVWALSNSLTAAHCSAIAYHFGKQIQEKLNVPVGLILNAVGGSPTESWIARRSLEDDPLFVDYFRDWKNNDFIDSWVRKRGVENIANATNISLQQHPYKPSYLYESAIRPLRNYTIAGAIWYQGESNADRVELYEQLFPALVKSWRTAFGWDFPFFYVQLSSMEVGRESWGLFRDCQRRFMYKIPNSGMAVSSDLGNRTDVHPRRKKEVGERLARLALAQTYQFAMVKSGPNFKSAVFDKDCVIVDFTDAARLKTIHDEPLKAFEVAGKDKVFYPATAIIKGDKVFVTSEKVPLAYYVRYGWSSYSEGNLVNEADLPASTFFSEYKLTIKE